MKVPRSPQAQLAAWNRVVLWLSGLGTGEPYLGLA
jgi:hypothetical protein